MTPHGARWDLDYDMHGRISRVREINTRGSNVTRVQYEYDAQGDLVSAIDGVGHRERYAYENHLITCRTLKSGYRFQFEWDDTTARARCLRNWGNAIDGQPTYDYRFQWQRLSRSVSITDTRGGVEHYTFNERGQPVHWRDQEGGATRYEYDAHGNLIAETDPAGRAQRFEYRHDRLIGITERDGTQTRLRRDAQGRLIEIIDALGQRWAQRYDERGRLIERTNPLGESTRYQYTAQGLPNALIDPLGHTTHYVWNPQAQLIAIRDALGRHTRYHYDEHERLRSIVWPDERCTEYRYDGAGRCTRLTHPDGRTLRFSYNALGLLAEQRDAQGHHTLYRYNGLSQVVKRIDALGHTLEYHYDGERNLVGLTNENGERYELKYDLKERLIEEVGFDGRVQQYEYDAAGQLTGSHEPAADLHLRYVRDANGQLLEQWHDVAGAESQRLKQFTYDAVGRLTAAHTPDRELRWRYDPVGRVIEELQDQHRLRHRYDMAGRRIVTHLPSSERVRYDFDECNAFTALHLGDQEIVRLSRDAAGRETERRHSNLLSTQTQYDPQGRLQRQATFKQYATTAIIARQYGYNAAGQLSQIDDLKRGLTQYLYDLLDRLTQVQGPNPETFVHDPAGNVLDGNAAGQVQGNRLRYIALPIDDTILHQIPRAVRLMDSGDPHFERPRATRFDAQAPSLCTRSRVARCFCSSDICLDVSAADQIGSSSPRPACSPKGFTTIFRGRLNPSASSCWPAP